MNGDRYGYNGNGEKSCGCDVAWESETRALEVHRWERKKNMGQGRSVARAVKLPSLAAVRRTVQIEPSGRQLYILNNIM